MNSPRKGTAVADRVPSHIAAATLDPNLAFALGRFEIARNFRQYRTVGDMGQRLTQDSRGLTHLADADHVTIHRITQLAPLSTANRHLEIELGIDRVRNVLADIELVAAGPQIGTNQIVVDRVLESDHTDVG